MKFFDQIIHGDNLEVMSKMNDEIVDLTITSPPYRNAIDYTMHAKHGNNPDKKRSPVIFLADEAGRVTVRK